MTFPFGGAGLTRLTISMNPVAALVFSGIECFVGTLNCGVNFLLYVHRCQSDRDSLCDTDFSL